MSPFETNELDPDKDKEQTDKEHIVERGKPRNLVQAVDNVEIS